MDPENGGKGLVGSGEEGGWVWYEYDNGGGWWSSDDEGGWSCRLGRVIGFS